jgi:hypothetical protein
LGQCQQHLGRSHDKAAAVADKLQPLAVLLQGAWAQVQLQQVQQQQVQLLLLLLLLAKQQVPAAVMTQQVQQQVQQQQQQVQQLLLQVMVSVRAVGERTGTLPTSCVTANSMTRKRRPSTWRCVYPRMVHLQKCR